MLGGMALVEMGFDLVMGLGLGSWLDACVSALDVDRRRATSSLCMCHGLRGPQEPQQNHNGAQGQGHSRRETTRKADSQGIPNSLSGP
jgi:hypothetical protein